MQAFSILKAVWKCVGSCQRIFTSASRIWKLLPLRHSSHKLKCRHRLEASVMLIGDLNQRALKLEREQKARLEQERRKAEREKLAEGRQKARRQRELDEAARRRAAASAEAELNRQQHDEEVEHNRGVWWQLQLKPMAIDERIALEKGIRRGVDKVSLPASAGNDLMRQDAPKNGALFFELRTAEGNSTHAGSLDFSAPEGTVFLPHQVAANLWADGVIPENVQLNVRYKRLQKGTYVRLKPATANFHQEVGDSMEEILVAALSKRSAVSVGDTLLVDGLDQTFELKVQQLLPAAQVSVIDTEMEADVEPSKETEERLKAEAEAERQKAAAIAAEAARREAEAAAEQARAAALLADLQNQQEAAAAALPQEPGADDSTITCLLRLPSGRHIRRFRYNDPVALLYTFAAAKGADRHGNYRLSTQYPRRVLENSIHVSFQQAGLTCKQETVLFEPLAVN